MQLSGDEQRMLDGIERTTLGNGDPDFASKLSFDYVRGRRRLGELFTGVAFVIGLGVNEQEQASPEIDAHSR